MLIRRTGILGKLVMGRIRRSTLFTKIWLLFFVSGKTEKHAVPTHGITFSICFFCNAVGCLVYPCLLLGPYVLSNPIGFELTLTIYYSGRLLFRFSGRI